MSEITRYVFASLPAIRSRNFRLYAGGQALSASGAWMQKLAQAWLVLVLTDSGFIVGLTVALQQLPTLALTAAGGAMADRFDRRRILITANACAVIPALALGTVVASDRVQIWMVMVAAAFQGFIDALEKPTRMSFVSDIVEPKLLTNAVTLNHIIQQSGKLVGPATAGILIGTAGLSTAFFANAASFLPVIIGLILIRPTRFEERKPKRTNGIRDTMRYVAGRRDLSTALALNAVVGLFGYNFQVLIPIMFRKVFHGDAAVAGFGLTCMGLGGVIGGLAVAGIIKASADRQVLMAWIFSAALTLIALAPTLWFAFVATFLMGATSVTFTATSGAHIQLASDSHMRGRMMGLFVMGLAGTSTVGGPIQGGIAELTSARVSFLAAAIAIAVAAAGAFRYSRGDGRDRPAESARGAAAAPPRDVPIAVPADVD